MSVFGGQFNPFYRLGQMSGRKENLQRGISLIANLSDRGQHHSQELARIKDEKEREERLLKAQLDYAAKAEERAEDR